MSLAKLPRSLAFKGYVNVYYVVSHSYLTPLYFFTFPY